MVRSRRSIGFFVVFSGALMSVSGAACSSSSASPATGSADGGGTPPSDDGGADGAVPGYPAAHTPMPQAVTLKGPVMTAPKLETITFLDDTLQAQIEKFGNDLAGAKDYWAGATSQYGVGPLTAPEPVHLDEMPAATLTDTDVQTWLTSKIAGGATMFPQPDANTIYTIYYPATTVVTMGGGSLCSAFQGYHSSFLLPGSASTYVTYSVVGRCPPAVAGLAEMDEVSAEATHETIEAATDPLPNDKPAYLDVDEIGKAWAFVGGGAEIGDLCAPFPDAFFNTAGVTNLVQRVWSNEAAAAGHAPCQPQGTSPYFNSAPVLPDTLTVNSSQGTFTTKGIKIAVGESKDVELDLYSDAPTSGPWTITVLDLTSAFFGGPKALSFSLSTKTGQNGDKVTLTIKAIAKSSLGASPFWIQNDLGKQQSIWIGVVGN